MKVYSLAINDEPVVEVEVDVPRWLPVRPVLNRRWLRAIVADAMERYFARKAESNDDLIAAASS